MQVSDYILNKINKFQDGYVFTYTDFDISVNKKDAVIKSLNRMVKSGKLRKLSKGKYYKPKKTEFGELNPNIYQVVKDLIEKDGKMIGYLTGYSVYNKLGLTTQVSNVIQIGVESEKKPLTRGMYKIRFIKQPNRISKENIPFLQILDAIRYIKDIPGTTVDKACKQLSLVIKKMKPNELNRLKKLALNYNASTRALTGAIIETVFNEKEALPMLESLNPITKYKFNISKKILPNQEKWNIV